MSELYKPFKYFPTLDSFNNTLIASDETNTKSIWGGELQDEAPEVLFESICFIENVKQIWNRGTFYCVDDFSLPTDGEAGQVLAKAGDKYEWQDHTVVSTKFVELIDDSEPKINYEFIDLGLPSGILWCAQNIGSFTPEDEGLYFQWGDTQGYKGGCLAEFSTPDNLETHCFFSSYYKWNNNSKYGSGNVNIQSEDDAAKVYISEECSIPNLTQYYELLDNTIPGEGADRYGWITNYKGTGINGMYRKSKVNDNTIFFPATGSWSAAEHNNINKLAACWTSELYGSKPDNGRLLGAMSGDSSIGMGVRWAGVQIRAVKKP